VIILNFAHPLTRDQLGAITTLTGCNVPAVRDVPAQFDVAQPFTAQVAALADACALSPVEWQTETILVNPPSLSVIATALTADLHGRMGYFAPQLRLRRVDGMLPVYEVAEILELQGLRDRARAGREL